MKKTGLDATDIRILSAVQNNGQISKTRLAEIVPADDGRVLITREWLLNHGRYLPAGAQGR